jgi:hypothetical protein
MAKITFTKNLKDTLSQVRGWKKLSDKDFKHKLITYMSVKDCENILKKYNEIKIEDNNLQLEFIITRDFISFTIENSSLFDLNYKDLMEVAKKNNFKIMNFGADNFKELLASARILSKDYSIIPLDESILIYLDDQSESEPNVIEIEGDNNTYRTENIK